MVDECLDGPVAKKLDSLRKDVTAVTSQELGFSNHASDDNLVLFTKNNDVVLVTADKNTINRSLFPPCSHGGIVVVTDPKWTEDTIRDSMKMLFAQKRRRQLVKNHFTYVSREEATIHTHVGTETFSLKKKARIRKSSARKRA